jgi:thioredoxin reductase (NADPH)
MSQHLIGEIAYSPRITVQPCSEVVDGGGAGHLEWIDVRDTTSGRVTRREAKGLFLLLGAEPHCDRLPPDIARDSRGFVLTGRDLPTEHWTGRLTPRRTSRPPCPECSPPATSARGR